MSRDCDPVAHSSEPSVRVVAKSDERDQKCDAMAPKAEIPIIQCVSGRGFGRTIPQLCLAAAISRCGTESLKGTSYLSGVQYSPVSSPRGAARVARCRMQLGWMHCRTFDELRLRWGLSRMTIAATLGFEAVPPPPQ